MCLNNNGSILAVLILLASCRSPEETPRRPLVNAAFIYASFEAGRELQIIDVRSEDEFVAGHIPGARQIWRSEMEDPSSEIPGMRINAEGLAARLGLLGIHSHDSIYLYDAKGNVDAARLWWLLQLYGFESVALIDGGYVQWRMNAFQVEQGFTDAIPTIFSFPGKERISLLAKKSDVLNGEYDLLIDARNEEEYNGSLLKNGALRGGHIPGAILLDYTRFINGGAFTIHDKSYLTELLKRHPIDPDAKTITYCHNGLRSAFATFVLTEILGMKEVSNYDGSWIEWSNDESCPVETEPASVKDPHE